MSLASAVHSVARLSLASLFVAGVSGCAARLRPEIAPSLPPPHSVGIEMIGELKDFAEALGGQATENFLRHSDRLTADNRCYFTGKFQLPEFYSTLRMVRDASRSLETVRERYGDACADAERLLEKWPLSAAGAAVLLKAE